MAFEITIPRLGWSMEEGTFAGWRKNEGEFVRRGDILFELEGEKALQEIEALDEGILKFVANSPKPGAVLKVGDVIGYLTAADEAVQGNTAATSDAELSAIPSAKASAPGDSVAAPSVRRLARELGVAVSNVAGTGPGGRVLEDDVRAAAKAEPSEAGTGDAMNNPSQTRQPAITPRARRAAARIGLDWTQISGTGKNGRIRERDVLKAAELHGSARKNGTGTSQPERRGVFLHDPLGASPIFSPLSSTTASSTAQRIPLSGRRKVIADRLAHSARMTVPVTITARADATNLMSLREQFKATSNNSDAKLLVPAVHDIVAKLVAAELTQHPLLAARWDGDSLILASADEIHLGLAVDTADGLIVPVIRHVNAAPLMAVAEESSRLIRKARDGRLSASELQDGVFTISNLGGFGVEFFTPVINFPETSILGLGAIRKEPVVTDDGQVVVRQMMPLSLTFDHRVIDGAPAAKFLQSVCAAIANPAAKLLASQV